MSRKIQIIVLAALSLFVGVAVLLAGPPCSHSVSASSVMVLPPCGIQAAPTWTTNVVYTQGDIVIYNGQFFWCQTAAGATNTIADIPKWETDGRSADGTNTWQYMSKNARNGFAIVNDGTNSIYLSFGSPAVTASGIRLNANGGSASDFSGLYQGAIYAISAGANNVTAQEW